MGIRGKETITILRYPETISNDVYGNPILDESGLTEIVVENCLVGIGSTKSNETLFQTEQNTEAVFQFPYGTDINYSDKFLYDGEIYQINTIPTIWKTQKGSRIKPKVLVEVRHGEG